MSVPAALPSAVFYGVGDFLGGLAARRAPVLAVTLVVQGAGLLTLLPIVWLLPGRASAEALVVGGLAGLAGASGLLLYYRGLAIGPMGVVAPLSAVIAAGLPLLVGLLTGERLGPVGWVAVVVALAAILLATAGTRGDGPASTGLLLGLASGAGFGLFFVGLDATPADSGLWPLVAGRAASTVLLGAIGGIGAARRPEGIGAARRPGGIGGIDGGRRLAAVSGLADTVANALFLVATRAGDLGVSAVLVALYPVVVVLLSWVVLRERLTATQLASAGLALTASALLAGA